MNFTILSVWSCIALFAGVILLTYTGRWLAKRTVPPSVSVPEASGTVTAAIFGLLGLLVAFTFSGAFSRLDARRQLVVQEVNAIGTAYLRLDLLPPPESQEPLRKKFRRYTASRAALFDLLVDEPAARAELDKQQHLQDEIWTGAVTASRNAGDQSARLLLLPALNEMIDITTTRTIAIQTHPPALIFIALFAVALSCALFIGYGANPKQQLSHLHIIGFAVMIAFMMYVILDVEFPRYGIVRLDFANHLFVELEESMK